MSRTSAPPWKRAAFSSLVAVIAMGSNVVGAPSPQVTTILISVEIPSPPSFCFYHPWVMSSFYSISEVLQHAVCDLLLVSPVCGIHTLPCEAVVLYRSTAVL